MPVVVFNKHQEYDSSWCDEVVSVMRPSVLGNPYPITSKQTRGTVIARYRDFLSLAMKGDTPQRKEIIRLRSLHLQGKTIGLICCCDPLPCHAHVIKEMIEASL